MSIEIRNVALEDVQAVHDIMLQNRTLVGTMRLPYQSLDHTQERLGPEDGVYKLSALIDGAVAGYCELITYPDAPRQRHAGEINMIVVHPQFKSQGVGGALMDAMIDLADNWVNLRRVSLSVWVQNTAAIKLYEQYGFEIEGRMRDYVFGQGTYSDALVMARIKA